MSKLVSVTALDVGKRDAPVWKAVSLDNKMCGYGHTRTKALEDLKVTREVRAWMTARLKRQPLPEEVPDSCLKALVFSSFKVTEATGESILHKVEHVFTGLTAFGLTKGDALSQLEFAAKLGGVVLVDLMKVASLEAKGSISLSSAPQKRDKMEEGENIQAPPYAGGFDH